MPRRSFETGYRCTQHFLNGVGCSKSTPGAVRCSGVMDVKHDTPYDDLLMEKRRKRRCVKCNSWQRTREIDDGPPELGVIDKKIVDTRPTLFDREEYILNTTVTLNVNLLLNQDTRNEKQNVRHTS